DGRQSGRDRGELFLSVAPGKILHHQYSQAPQNVHQEKKDETAFGEPDQRLIAPAQEAFKRRLAVNGETERQEMQRQEDGERQAGKPVHQRRDPEHALAAAQVAHRHGSTPTPTAPTPRRTSSAPQTLSEEPALR